MEGTRPDDATAGERRARQRDFWRQRYTEDPAFFGRSPSDFARWCLPLLRAEASTREVIELGCGYGRDTRYFAQEGFLVRGVDLAGIPVPDAEGATPSVEVIEAECLDFLERQGSGSADAVYSNMFFNMDFTEEEHRVLFRAVHRVLRPAGLHLYSARSTSDPWYGRGRPIGPDTFDPAPHGVPMHYFSEDYADRLATEGFVAVRRLLHPEGEPGFPITLLYVVDRRR